MALDFPSSPATGDTYAPGGNSPFTYTWDGTAWNLLNSTGINFSSAAASDNAIFQYNSTAGQWQPVTDNYAFRAVKNTAQTSIPQSTKVTVTFGAEDFDDGAVYDGTDTFTAPVDGVYHFSTSVLLDSMENNAYAQVELLINGAFSSILQRAYQSSGTAAAVIVGGSDTLRLAQNATVAVQIITNGTGSDSLPGNTSHFSGHLVKAI